jgi:hypothetical protein
MPIATLQIIQLWRAGVKIAGLEKEAKRAKRNKKDNYSASGAVRGA